MTPDPDRHGDRPNVLVFMTDDHGAWALGCAGAKQLHTPSMDAIAAAGVMMTNASCPLPVCSPARASFWTGRIPSSHGIHDYLQETTDRGRAHPGLTGQANLGTRLQRAGYRTGMVGKWHCGGSDRVQPGFDFWLSISRGTDARFGDQLFCDNGQAVTAFGHQAPMLTDAALRFLRDDHADPQQPWFLFVGYTDTHGPFRGQPRRFTDVYRRCRFDDLAEDLAPCHGHPKPVQPQAADDMHECNAQYFAAVNTIDEQVGRILDELQSRGELEHTLVVYTADHGHMNGHHGLWGKGNATVPQNFLDEAIRVPCLLAWPTGFDGGQRLNQLVDHCDLHATLLDAAGTEPTPGPGRSYLPLLRGEAIDWRDAQFCEYGNARMIRTPEAKLILRYPGPNGRFADELYDLCRDPRETRNVVDQPQWAEVVRTLTERLDAYFDRWQTSGRGGLDAAAQPRPNGSEPWFYQPRPGAATRTDVPATTNG